MRKKTDMVELSIRMPSDGWKELTALLLKLMGAEGDAAADEPRSGGENAAFDGEVYQRLRRAEEETLPRRLEGSIDAPLSAPAPAGYGGMEGTAAVMGRKTANGGAGEGAEENRGAEHPERRWERDCRRYDSGFPLR